MSDDRSSVFSAGGDGGAEKRKAIARHKGKVRRLHELRSTETEMRTILEMLSDKFAREKGGSSCMKAGAFKTMIERALMDYGYEFDVEQRPEDKAMLLESLTAGSRSRSEIPTPNVDYQRMNATSINAELPILETDIAAAERDLEMMQLKLDSLGKNYSLINGKFCLCMYGGKMSEMIEQAIMDI